MQASGYRLNLPPTTLKARFVMIEESSKTMYDVDLATPELGNPASWASEGIKPSYTGNKWAIVIPVRLDAERRMHIASRGGNPDFEVGKLVSITHEEHNVIYADVIGRVNVCPFHETVMSWDKLKEYKGDVMHDELKNGLLERVFGDRNLGVDFVHPDVLARVKRPWHLNAEVLNAELDGIFASGNAIQVGRVRWMLSEEDQDDDRDMN